MRETYLAEGERTRGVWQPLALADIEQTLMCIIRMFAAHPSEMKVPKKSEILRGWVLPMTAAAVATEEETAEANALLASVEELERRYNRGKL